MMKAIFSSLVCALLIASPSRADTPSQELSAPRAYPFIIVHHPARISTMKQFDQNYLSTYRILSRELVQGIGLRKASIVQLGFALIGIPLTHEEGHRSVLTTKGIGSISRPYPDEHLTAYVEGVTDATLIDLRDSDLPTYIRLHTAGLESDYVLGNRCVALAAFEAEDPRHIYLECLMRRLSHIGYFATSVFSALEPDLSEEENELDRDIVGHDVYGAIRHLHRPNDPFYRYTKYDDLTDAEQDFVGRVALRSLTNLFTPFLLGRANFEIHPGVKLSGGFGYSMSPFGDFVDEHLWALVGRDIRLHVYARQFQNRDSWFPAGGASIHSLPLTPWLRATAALHLWRQPEGLDFNTSAAFTGALAHLELELALLRFGGAPRPKYAAVTAGVTAKSRGFVPEESYLRRKVGMLLGITVAY